MLRNWDDVRALRCSLSDMLTSWPGAFSWADGSLYIRATEPLPALCFLIHFPKFSGLLCLAFSLDQRVAAVVHVVRRRSRPRVRMRKLPAVCKFCVCVVSLFVCGECLCKRPHAQMRCSVRILSLRGLLAGAPEAASAGPGPELVVLLLRGLLAGAPEAAPAGLGLDLFILLLKSYRQEHQNGPARVGSGPEAF